MGGPVLSAPLIIGTCLNGQMLETRFFVRAGIHNNVINISEFFDYLKKTLLFSSIYVGTKQVSNS